MNDVHLTTCVRPRRVSWWGPALDRASSRAQVRAHAAQNAGTHGFTIHAEHSLACDAARGVFVYDIRTSLDVQDESVNTRLPVTPWANG